MAFAIMRAKKLNSMGSVAASLQHCYRERETPNADQARTPENEHYGARSSDEAMGRLRERLPEKRRKDAVLAVEYVMTASPDWWKTANKQQQQAFFNRSMDWLAAKYGKENIVAASVHRDEASPHLSAFVVPRTADGRLSAKEFIGNREKMRNDQTSFAQRVADLGLERGIEGSQATHQRVKSYYAALEQSPKVEVTITPEDLTPRRYKPQGITERLGLTYRAETPDDVAARLTKKIDEGYAPVVLAASGARVEREKARTAQETAQNLRNRLKPVLEALNPLNKENQAKVLGVMRSVGEKALEMQREVLRQKMTTRQKERGRDGPSR